MAQIIRNRTIRPSSRLERSKNYKVSTAKVLSVDTLIVNIDHESKPFKATYTFKGSDVAHKESISFRVTEDATSIKIEWSGAQPIGNKSKELMLNPNVGTLKNSLRKPIPDPEAVMRKISFEPISNPGTVVLILGTMPGDKSLKMSEYYAHSRNRFWKIISIITKQNYPKTYSEKKELLLNHRIGIWDVAHSVIRKGSLDYSIVRELPNDLESFVLNHKKLKVVAFNGSKAEQLFNKYFARKPNLKYLSLPSTSPANTGFDFDTICKKWSQIEKYVS
jgi:hypoxanthine-DNA glycosylase